MANLLEDAPGLLAFVRSADRGSFSAAARDLGTTPSAVSRAVARLEQRLGRRLFLRSTRVLTLTPEGQAFHETVAPLLKEIDAAGDAVGNGLSGKLKISLPSELARILMDAILDKFARPNPTLNLEIGTTDRHVDVIREGYDVAFRVGRLSASGLIARKLADMEMVIVASPDLIAKHGEPRTVEELAALPFARYVGSSEPFAITFSNGTTISPAGAIDCDSGFALQRSALRGMGAAYLMEHVVRDDLRQGALVRLVPSAPLPTLPLNAVHAFGRNTPPRIVQLCDLIARELRQMTPPQE